MSNSNFRIPAPVNEPIFSYAKNTKERTALKNELTRQSSIKIEIPIIIGGKEIKTNNIKKVVMPHNHKHVLAEYHIASDKELALAIKAAKDAKETWQAMPFNHRAAIFLKAADLISTKYRYLLNAATMLGQSKTAFQAEIDTPCELIDFLKFNAHYAEQIFSNQPISDKGTWNRLEYRPLDGFVAAISPFNFTAIAGNLSACPAMLGNTIIWKPASTAMLSNYYIMKVFEEAGLPAGVINFVPSSGADFSKIVLEDKDLGGVHFTGSTKVFKDIWQLTGKNINKYKSYPRLVGETGGKDFLFAHNSVAIDSGILHKDNTQLEQLAVALIRGAFEYQGQKCSALSRAYIPSSIWEDIKKLMLEKTAKLKTGDVSDFSNFLGAVIDKNSFDNIKKYIDAAKADKNCQVLCGGYDDKKGYFVEPTIIVTKEANYVTMKEEIFGPVLTIYVYDDKDFDKTLELCGDNEYALTGAIWGRDREILTYMEKALQSAAGNFYINDKCTGAVVGQQPFGGGKASGTNDKAGSILNLFRWLSPRTIKETFNAPSIVEYPFMDNE
ncbi:MAG: L-glutamate gamma-semialdehyde dehydrogenase [Firmicutes bacterium]|nr:L-glutamate gamma-semialdehyde dehydrogenase [Bacillota bacterium]